MKESSVKRKGSTDKQKKEKHGKSVKNSQQKIENSVEKSGMKAEVDDGPCPIPSQPNDSIHNTQKNHNNKKCINKYRTKKTHEKDNGT